MTKIRKTFAVLAGASAVFALQQSAAIADPVTPDHAVITCASASFYANYDSAGGPTGLKRTLPQGDKVGHTRGAHPVYNGWAATFDFGPNDWGYVRVECLGGYGSW
ncbi:MULTISPECIES: hypothetical protein [Streptomyces]|uniref:SH3 domain-containing protein n=1 Tax=Streptomyces albus (strain ATCC 21838 / DSM 41398 / FERM P-419 / JCM 4703 / NBRC 107858) TaxID=1081613 RepID=A0A0B5EXK4_STRA4|nr:hypothetical protein [Streptomyces sp. SCSIO ZS0520]AJE86559.1 hypothetical protein SLNWT_6183 [Streptomyces albus]AOU80863.1 hypothetical protein SLNHY_6172 [Streptomyces albus]AYN36566.1 hypothetical protein DUI70_6072 [Streptomyces albus]